MTHFCMYYILSCPSTGPKMFFARPKDDFHLFSKFSFCAGTNIFGATRNFAQQLLTATNPVQGQGIPNQLKRLLCKGHEVHEKHTHTLLSRII